MSILNKKEPIILALGDILAFFLALFGMLFIRYGIFSKKIFYLHLYPFCLLFVVWIGIFFIAGLYEKHTLILQSRLPRILLKTALVNIFLAVIFFYFIPYFGIAPKVNMFIYLFLSCAFILAWRMYGYRTLYAKKKQNAISIGSGTEFAELAIEVNRNRRYGIRFVASVEVNELNAGDFKKNILGRIESERVTLVAVDFQNKKVEPILPYLYELIFKDVQLVDIHQLYEDIFDRIPLSLMTYKWFLEHVSISPSTGYDALKRFVDVALSLVLGVVSLALYPFVFLAIKMDDRGPAFVVQERVGRDGKVIKIVKFRSMRTNDKGFWVRENDDRITRVGAILRKTRVDELPQLWNVLKGDMSLVGPRPDIYSLGLQLSREIPFYATRNTIKPGLSGWAQIKQQTPPQSIEETKLRLAYDLYYIIHRSFFLDLKISLQTIATLLSRAGK